MEKVNLTEKGLDTTSDPVEAVVTMRSPTDYQVLSPKQSKAMAESVLAKASAESATNPESYTIFENMHSFSVRASQKFLDAVAQNKDVLQILPNAIDGDGLIEPVKGNSVQLPNE